MTESQSPPSRTPSPPLDDAAPETAREDVAREDVAREGVSERGGEGGYGNDTGFATGTEAPRDRDQGGLSEREQDTSDTYRDAGGTQ